MRSVLRRDVSGGLVLDEIKLEEVLEEYYLTCDCEADIEWVRDVIIECVERMAEEKLEQL